MKRAALAILPALAACTIIIDGNTPPPGGGGTPDICAPDDGSRPRVDIIFDVRIERTVAGLRDHYGRLMRKSTMGLMAAGLRPGRAVLFPLDERPVASRPLAAWGCDLGGFDLAPEEVIEFYATQTPPKEAPLGCGVDPLLEAGANLPDVVTAYPPEIGGTSGLRVFGEAPDAVVVLHLDSLARRAAFDGSTCASASKLAEVNGDGHATWLAYSAGAVKADRVFHWFVYTDEGVDRDTFVERCRREEGFPVSVLDLLEPSAQILYQPLAEAITASGGRADQISLCAMLSPSKEQAFLDARIRSVASSVGARVDETILEQVLVGDGSLPSDIGGERGTPGPDGM